MIKAAWWMGDITHEKGGIGSNNKLCTGHSERIDEAGAKDMGISAFAFKPIEKKALAQMVRQVPDQG